MDKKDVKAILLYLFFGVITTVVNILTYEILAGVFGINFAVSNVIAWILGVSIAYVTNKLYVFESKKKNKEQIKEVVYFFVVRIFSLIIDMCIMFVGIKILLLDDFLVKILSNIVVIITNYVMSKYVVFTKEDKKLEEVKSL